MIDKVICPECIKEEKKSIVYDKGASKTLMEQLSTGHYDEEGNYHKHEDPNITTNYFVCTNGHRFTIRTRGGKIIE